ncbi:internal scaffolding protein [Sigmofec virus UA08Rod_6044]|uniref:Internal scaffolding protein n=1 Tax=Sigmofec virus UA08Rod_6044 TaxID=2929448 RepID=A0A976N0U8_9VIRU|nr:internal scaffolding protein [Sigmofec virus UA08Rod_6044]
MKFETQYDRQKEKEGKTYTEDSLTDQSQAEDTDIYSCLKKYGITTLVNQTKAKEFMYLDNTNRNLTLDEAVRQRQQMEEYFLQQPARVRKAFGDSVDQFIEEYKMGKYGNMLDTGILTNEMIEELTKSDLTIEQPPIKGEIKNGKIEENLQNSNGM